MHDGKTYRKGYYDEDGNYYSDMAIKNEKTGNYQVYTQCEYCGTQKIVNWKEGETLTCDACGAPLNVKNIPKDEDADETMTTSAASDSSTRSKFRTYLLVIIILVVLANVLPALMNRTASRVYESYLYDDEETYSYSEEDNTEIWGATVYLKETEDGRYTIADSSDYDKYMYWDSSVDSYYDYTTGSYVWYNTYVSPNLWQYWFDGISTDYEDAGYGWMEYENGTWYMETDEGEWTDITDQYDTSELWHIDNEFDYESSVLDGK